MWTCGFRIVASFAVPGVENILSRLHHSVENSIGQAFSMLETQPQDRPPLRWHNLRRSEGFAIAAGILLLAGVLALTHLFKREPIAVNHSGVPVQSRLDVNTAGPEALAVIPGVGEATARAIVAERESRGVFTSLDDFLARTPRLSREKLRGFAEYLEFSGPK